MTKGDKITVIWKDVKDAKNKAWVGKHYNATVENVAEEGVQIKFDGESKSKGLVVESDNEKNIPLDWVRIGSENDRKLDESRILGVNKLYARLLKDSGIVVASLNALAYLKF